MSRIKKHFYKINTDKINSKRIVLLSDIHYFNKNDAKKLDKVFIETKKLKPDYICIAGDLLDFAYVNDKDVIKNWIMQLSNIAKVIIGIGNHDLLVKTNFEAGFDRELFNNLENIPNVKVVNNDSITIDNICFMGITLSAEYYYCSHEQKSSLAKYINASFPKVDAKKFNVLLCHTPLQIWKEEVISKIKIKPNLDLILSGHNHGGVTPECLKPILKGIGIYSPLREIFFKNAYGHINVNGTNIVISSGITKLAKSNHVNAYDFLFRREITIIDIN